MHEHSDVRLMCNKKFSKPGVLIAADLAIRIL